MKQFFTILKNHVSILLPVIVLFIIAVINSFSNIGLVIDGPRQFFSALMVNDVFYGKEHIGNYVYIVRYFPSMIPQVSIFLSVLIGITNVKILLTIFTFAIYCSPVIFLIILYLNIPENKKHIFNIILLSFLICFVYMKYFVLSESFLTILFLLIVFVIYFYIDFNKLTIFNLLCLSIFSIFLFSSHPNVIIFIPFFIYVGVSKYLKTQNICFKNNIVIITSFLILIQAFVFNVFCIVYPFAPYHEYLELTMLKDLKFIYFILSVCFIIGLSFFKAKTNKIFIIITILVCFIICYIVINIKPVYGVFYRMLNLYITIIFMGFITFISIFKNKINYTYIRILNVMLILSLLISTVVYANKNNAFNLKIVDYISKNKTIPVSHFIRDTVKNKNDEYAAILFLNIFPNPNFCKIEIDLNDKYHTLFINEERFKKFGMDIGQLLIIKDSK